MKLLDLIFGLNKHIMTDYRKQASRIYSELLARHPKGAVTTTVRYRLKSSDFSEMQALAVALHKRNRNLTWAWHWPIKNHMRIRVVQKRK